MASKKQIKANQENAQKSTGPKTAEGKKKSSQNSLTHGLTAVIHFDESEREEIDIRIKEWSDELVVNGSAVQRDLVRLAALSYQKILRGLKAEDADRAYRSANAEQLWKVEKSRELSGYVGMIEENPFVAVQGLQGSLVGTEWLVKSWDGILHAFNNNCWTTDCHQRARRLMGVAEKDDVMGRCLPDIWHRRIQAYQAFYNRRQEPFCLMPWEERVLRIERIELADAEDDRIGDEMLAEVQPMADAYEAVMNSELIRLNLALKIHKANEPMEIAAARNRALIDVTPEGKLRERYQHESAKLMWKNLDGVLKMPAQMAKQGSSGPRNEAKAVVAEGSTNQQPKGPRGAVAPKIAETRASGPPPTA